MIQAIHLDFTHHGSPNSLFRDLNLTIPGGETKTLIGPSGSGKTTLLKLLAGLLVPNNGEIHLNGSVMPAHDTGRAQLRNQNVGVIFQDYVLLPNLTVTQNLLLRRSIAGLAGADDSAVLERVGLADFRNTPVHRLSGGQQQRLAAVRALITQPAIILADEPTGNLDDTSAAMILDLLTDQATDTTILIATHDPRVLSRFGDPLNLADLEAQP